MLPRFQTRRTSLDGVRHYSCDGHLLPSVTAVLGETEDKSWLVAWRERIGHVEADRISAEASALGTRTHSLNKLAPTPIQLLFKTRTHSPRLAIFGAQRRRHVRRRRANSVDL